MSVSFVEQRQEEERGRNDNYPLERASFLVRGKTRGREEGKRKLFLLLQVETSIRYLRPPLYKFASFEFIARPESREIKTRF